jgi:hypothetical protein
MNDPSEIHVSELNQSTLLTGNDLFADPDRIEKFLPTYQSRPPSLGRDFGMFHNMTTGQDSGLQKTTPLFGSS